MRRMGELWSASRTLYTTAMFADENRRRFLQYLLASPLLAAGQQGGQAPESDVITSVTDAINVLEFEAVARKKLPPAHYGYLATGVEDDDTLRANRSGFQRFYLRPRRLIDIRKVDTRMELFGAQWESPIAFAPIGNTMAFHPEGEVAVAKA